MTFLTSPTCSIGNSYETADPDTTVALLLDSYFELVQQVYEKGARQFLFLTVPPTTRSPLIMSRGSADAHAAYVSMYNLQLMLKTEIFKESNSDVSNNSRPSVEHRLICCR